MSGRSSGDRNSPYEGHSKVPLAGYTDKLSARPGETVRVFLSAPRATKVTARLNRSFCADPNPKGSGIVETDASEWFEERIVHVDPQPIQRGSFARTHGCLSIHYPMEMDAHKNLCRVKIDVWFFPTLVVDTYTRGARRKEQRASSSSSRSLDEAIQNLWSWSNTFRLDLLPDGRLRLVYKNWDSAVAEVACMSQKSLRERKWYHITSTLELDPPLQRERFGEKKCLVSCHLSISEMDDSSGALPRCEKSSMEDAHGDASSSTSRGRKWDGTEFCWRHCPEHYGAIHFHDDDLYDCAWSSKLKWTVPLGIPSGIYVLRFAKCETSELYRSSDAPEECWEVLPIFICAPKIEALPPSSPKPRRTKLVLLIPTFTYVMYGNHARPDFDAYRWLARTREAKSSGAYPHNPSLYPSYGLSSYNVHPDGSGIHFAFHRRPLFNLRPGYITFGKRGDFASGGDDGNQTQPESYCSGLRHFPADSHIVGWLRHHGLDCDVITDHELHREGVQVLAGYSTLLTATHPEYHTQQSLDALRDFRDTKGGNMIYLGGNGFYWKIAVGIGISNASRRPGAPAPTPMTEGLLEIRRCEGGVRTWASEPGEYYHCLDHGTYGGLWRNSNRPPSLLTGIEFASQGSFVGRPYHRTCWDRPDITDWVFAGIPEDQRATFGDFGYSGDGAAGYELDRFDPSCHHSSEDDVVVLASSLDTKTDGRYSLVPEDVLTPWTNTAGTSNKDAKRADMVYWKAASSGSRVFSVGSITFCGCLPYNNYDNSVSRILHNVVTEFLREGEAGDNDDTKLE
eukprot:jgi/Psemu1/289323/fgenesh1_pg.347_\